MTELINSKHNLYFQQDGASDHNYRGTSQFLTSIFNDKCSGPYGPIQWPPRSPHLDSLDFFCGAT